jgi:hypothetical protein
MGRLDYYLDPPVSAAIRALLQPVLSSSAPVTDHRMPMLSRVSGISRNVVAGAILALAVAGCVGPQTVRCPIEDAALTKKILEVVPVGTPRDEAIKRMREAGIGGAFGSEHSAFGKDYFCCQTWRRSNGEVWRISLLLHFDKSGKLCETLDLPDLNADRAKPAKSTT